MDLSFRLARQQAYDDPAIGGAMGFYGTAASVAANSLTDAILLGGTARSLSHFNGQGRVIFPMRGVNDRQRDPGDLTAGGNGILALTGPGLSFAGATNEYYEFLRRGLRFEQLLQAWTNALWEVYCEESSAVSQFLVDGDCEDQNYGAWAVSHPDLSFTYSADPADHLTGYHSLLLTFGGALNTRYLTQAADFYLAQGEQVWLRCYAKLISGPGPIYWDVYNQTTGARVRSQVSSLVRGQWLQFGGQYAASSAGNYNIRIGANAGSVVAVDCLPNHYLGSSGLNWTLPARIDENFKLIRLDEYRSQRQLATDLQAASSRQISSWRHRIDYATETLAAEANPGSVQVLRKRLSLPAADLFYRARRRVADIVTVDELTPVPGPDVMLYAAFRAQLLAMLESRDHLGPRGNWMLLKAQDDATVASQREVTEEPTASDVEPRRSRMAV